MTIQGVVLGLLIGVIPAGFFHFLRGGSLNRLMLTVAASWVGFFAGHLIGEWLDWHLMRIGVINLFPALLASLLAIWFSAVLAGAEPGTSGQRNGGRRRRR